MPDKYSYKQTKKKKAVRPAATTPSTSAGQAKPVATASAVSAAPRTAAVASAPAATAPTHAESRVAARISNLGAELRRVILLGGVIVVVLVAAALALN